MATKDLDDSTHPVWVAVGDVASLEAVITAVRSSEPEWAVTQLVEASVRAALAAQDSDRLSASR